MGEDESVADLATELRANSYMLVYKTLVQFYLLMLFGFLTWLMFKNEKNDEKFQALYATLISATTIGYGDISPSQPLSRYVGAFILPLLTNAFAAFFGNSEHSGSGDSADKCLFGMPFPDLDSWKDTFLEGVTYYADAKLRVVKQPTATTTTITTTTTATATATTTTTTVNMWPNVFNQMKKSLLK